MRHHDNLAIKTHIFFRVRKWILWCLLYVLWSRKVFAKRHFMEEETLEIL
jgi:hypothetical protein